MVVRVLGAFRAAGFAHVRAQLAELRCKRAVPRHVARGQTADGCAVQVESDALRHHLDVGFAKASHGTIVAGVGAGIACLDTRLVQLRAMFCSLLMQVGPGNPARRGPCDASCRRRLAVAPQRNLEARSRRSVFREDFSASMHPRISLGYSISRVRSPCGAGTLLPSTPRQ